jgi:formylglycine-generating enzyme required for sulfatase activity
MRLFVSYALVDKPYCEQIVSTLEMHDVWYDPRVRVGTHWWNEILYHLRECQGFIYLLSPESVASEYCRRELEIASELKKLIFPVLIHNRTPIPESLREIQYVDFSSGLTPDAVKVLLNSILRAERMSMSVPQSVAPETITVPPPGVDPMTVIDEAVEAFEASDFDRAVFLLKYAKESGFEWRFIDIGAVLDEAQCLLDIQMREREAEREYEPIVALIRREATRQLGCKAFQAFREQYPDYDPENLAATCATVVLPLMEWCDIQGGEVMLEYSNQRVTSTVKSFRVTRYPITNAQFQVFADAPDGYADARWWDFSPASRQWHKEHPTPLNPKFAWEDHPRANVCWYEAVAFCRWLSHQTGSAITLPTEEQWQWAAQGPDGRIYPWGNKFHSECCNTTLSKIRMTTPVSKYNGKGDSPFGVCDMAGNVWEWCLNAEPMGHATNGNGKTLEDARRAVRGGSFISAPDRAQTTFHFYLNPVYFYATIGFRVICEQG